MNSNAVIFLDSGIGGLPYYRWVADRSADRRLIYVADNANFPYGGKSPETLIELAVSLVRNLTDQFNPEIIVLSCNTLSVVALSSLRNEFSVPLVGVVPAVKPAAENTEKRSIGVIATKRTIQDEYLAQLISQFASHCSVHPFAANSLVQFVEKNLLTAGEREKESACSPAVSFFKEKGIDTLVLGCTHFIFLKEAFTKLLGPGVKVIDSVEGVGNQVFRLLGESAVSKDPMRRNGIFYHTAEDPDSDYLSYAENFHMSYGGVLPSPKAVSSK